MCLDSGLASCGGFSPTCSWMQFGAADQCIKIMIEESDTYWQESDKDT